jgi:hypothetical protein
VTWLGGWLGPLGAQPNDLPISGPVAARRWAGDEMWTREATGRSITPAHPGRCMGWLGVTSSPWNLGLDELRKLRE